MRKLLKILGIALVLLLLFIGGVFYFSADVVVAANAFLQELADDDWDGAAEYYSDEFRASAPPAEIRKFLTDNGLHQYQSSSWNNRSVAPGTATLEGKVTTQAGSEISLKMDFVKQDGSWKVYHIERYSAGISSRAATDLQIPDRAAAAILVKNTTGRFAQALQARDFTEFHSSTSREFQDQIPLAKFNELFGSFLDQAINLTVLDNYSPMFTTNPAMSAEGVLQLQGHYATRPSQVRFEYEYIHRDDAWELLGIYLNLVPVEGEP